jgi:hypothetical protein
MTRILLKPSRRRLDGFVHGDVVVAVEVALVTAGAEGASTITVLVVDAITESTATGLEDATPPISLVELAIVSNNNSTQRREDVYHASRVTCIPRLIGRAEEEPIWEIPPSPIS